MARFSPFGATLTLRAVGQDTTLLVLEGSYEPPKRRGAAR